MILSNLKQKLALPLVLGLCDGVITVLTLIANRLINSDGQISFGFAVQISLVSLITGLFVYFISQYTELRRELLHLENELNLTESGHLAMTNLGKQIIIESVILTIIGSIAAFIGSLVPVVIAIFVQGNKWAPILVAVVILAILGLFLAKLVHGSKIRWILSLIISGLIVSYIGIQLNIVP